LKLNILLQLSVLVADREVLAEADAARRVCHITRKQQDICFRLHLECRPWQQTLLNTVSLYFILPILTAKHSKLVDEITFNFIFTYFTVYQCMFAHCYGLLVNHNHRLECCSNCEVIFCCDHFANDRMCLLDIKCDIASCCEMMCNKLQTINLKRNYELRDMIPCYALYRVGN
jgi:hypothetical protein